MRDGERLSFSPYLKKNSSREEWAAWVRANHPIRSIAVYPNGCVEVLRKGTPKPEGMTGTRERITKMSDKSLRRLMFVANRSTCEFGSMLTLTYPGLFPINGSTVKGDLNAILQKLRNWGFKFLWFLEFQKRGAPHIHILVETSYISPRMRATFALSWTMRIAKSGWFSLGTQDKDFNAELLKIVKVNLHPGAWEVIRNENGARNYVMKYAAKMSQKEVPKAYQDVGRFWGVSTKALPTGEDPIEITETQLRKWLEQRGHPAFEWHLIPRFLWGADEIEGQADHGIPF